ncbi:MAG: hypothetical protein HY690_04025 [Chloroflexi bacterium]|nr:hypothetical protein [Chloroflexota bacterium]
MTIKEELHSLVDRLGDEQAMETLAFLRRLVRQGEVVHGKASASLTKRMGPRTVSGRAFHAQPSMNLEALAAQQGVRPVAHFDELLGNFWPEEENVPTFWPGQRAAGKPSRYTHLRPTASGTPG